MCVIFPSALLNNMFFVCAGMLLVHGVSVGWRSCSEYCNSSVEIDVIIYYILNIFLMFV